MFDPLTRRADLRERMDDPDCREDHLLRTLRQFTSINFLVARYRTVLGRWVLDDMARDPTRAYRLADLGAGGCDIDAWLLREARRRGLRLRVTACDADPRVVAYACAAYGQDPDLQVQTLDVVRQTLDEPVDYTFGNHFLHHLTDDTIVQLLQCWSPVTRRSMVFSDLLRSRWAYAGFYLTSWLYRCSFAREDGLVSIRKGFRAEELTRLARKAGCSDVAVVDTLVPSRLVLRIAPGATEAPGVS